MHANDDNPHDFPSDWSFQHLPDAPFSPRSGMLLFVDESGYGESFDGVFRLFVLGGEVGYRCGLRELGVCSDEVWVAELRRANNHTRQVNLTWSYQDPATVPRLPFPARCGASLLHWSAVHNNAEIRVKVPSRQLKAVVGGQLSYDDATCQSPPVATNDVFYSLGPPDQAQEWYEGPAAPFSPRRSQQHDDAFIHAGGRLVILPSLTLIGGIHYDALRFDPVLNQSVLVQATMFADVWECVLSNGLLDLAANVSVCDWTGLGGASAPGGEAQWPADSVPLVTANGASVTAIGGIGGLRIGGRTSRASIAAWNAQPPVVRFEVGPHLELQGMPRNVSLMLSAYKGRAAQSWEDVMNARFHLPLQQTLDEAELNDPSAPYTAGSDFVMAHWSADQFWYPVVEPISVLHLQPWSQADIVEQATMYLPQAASSLNTSRPLHNFRFARFGHGTSYNSWMGRWGTQVITGGRSGNHYSNDWITVGPSRCAPPDSPQFRLALGFNVSTLSMSDRYSTSLGRDDVPEWAQAVASCSAGYHWEPPQLARQMLLYCGPESMWYSAEMTVPTCVEGTLDCPPGLVDLGFDVCVEQIPRIVSIQLDDASALNVDDVTITGALLRETVQLVIRGQYFHYPVLVHVGGYECDQPTLWFTNSSCGAGEQCYAPEIRCSMPVVMGWQLLVTVRCGVRQVLAEVANARVPTITSTPPIVMSVTSPDCSTDASFPSPFVLVDCPNDRRFNVTIQLAAYSVMLTQEELSVEVRFGTQLLPCMSYVFHDQSFGDTYRVNCSFPPRLGELIPLRVSQTITALQSQQDSVISYNPCARGYKSNPDAKYNGTLASLPCSPCPPGYSTGGAFGVAACLPCLPGYVSGQWGQGECDACLAGQFQPEANAQHCEDCPINSYTALSASSRCDACQMNTYIQFQSASVANCLRCPDSAQCDVTGNISASTGSYLIIDQPSSSVSSVPCQTSACQSVLPDDAYSRAECGDTEPQRVSVSRLAVRNCCAAGRLPAYDPSNPLLKDTDGANILCALCLPDYTEINGKCISCPSIQWLPVVATISVLLVAIFALHRLPSDWGGSASLSIVTFFLQLALLFLSAETMPQILSVVNLELFGDHVSSRGRQSGSASDPSSQVDRFHLGFCVWPMSAQQHITLRLLSPLIALACLAVIALIQLVLRSLLTPTPGRRSRAQRMYRMLFLPVTRGVEQRSSLRFMWVCYRRTCIRIALTVYPSICMTVLSNFPTISVGAYGSRLLDYPSIDPTSPSYRSLVPAMYTLLVLVVLGLPTIMAAFILLERRRVAKIGDDDVTKDSRNEAPLPEVAEAVASGTAVPGATEVALGDVSSQVFSMYRPGLEWYAAFNLVRRLLLVVIVEMVRGAAVWPLLLLATCLLLSLHQWIRPYRREVDNQHETLALLALCTITGLLAIFPPPFMTLWLLLVLVALLVCPLVPLIARTVLHRLRWLLKRRSAAAGNDGVLHLQAALLGRDSERAV